MRERVHEEGGAVEDGHEGHSAEGAAVRGVAANWRRNYVAAEYGRRQTAEASLWQTDYGRRITID